MTDTLKLEDLAPDRFDVELPSGEKTPMLDPRELSLYDRARVARMSQKVMDLNQAMLDKDPSQELAAELERTYRAFAAVVLPEASEEVIASLAPLHLDQVTGAFLGRYGGMMMRVADTIQDRMPKEAAIPGS